VDEEVKHALRRQVGQVASGAMGGELADPAVVSQARTLRESFELDEPGEGLIPRG
jgi:hypothetical protein